MFVVSDNTTVDSTRPQFGEGDNLNMQYRGWEL